MSTNESHEVMVAVTIPGRLVPFVSAALVLMLAYETGNHAEVESATAVVRDLFAKNWSDREEMLKLSRYFAGMAAEAMIAVMVPASVPIDRTDDVMKGLLRDVNGSNLN